MVEKIFHECNENDFRDFIKSRILYHMQHPTYLYYNVEKEAKLHHYLDKKREGALLWAEIGNAVRIQRPYGLGGFEILCEKFEELNKKYGVLVCGLSEEDKNKFLERYGKYGAGFQYVDEVLFSNPEEFDEKLSGSAMKHLRWGVNNAKREGIEISNYKSEDFSECKEVYHEWVRRIKPTWTEYILDILSHPSEESIILKATFNGRIIGVTSCMTLGDYAYFDFTITRDEHGRACELLDYQMLCKLKEMGIKRLDWGLEDVEYKQKYQKLKGIKVHTGWMRMGLIKEDR